MQNDMSFGYYNYDTSSDKTVSSTRGDSLCSSTENRSRCPATANLFEGNGDDYISMYDDCDYVISLCKVNNYSRRIVCIDNYASIESKADNCGATNYPRQQPATERPLFVEKRNARERYRVHAVNKAFHRLRQMVPALSKRSKRISKKNTLLKALEYIKQMRMELGVDGEEES